MRLEIRNGKILYKINVPDGAEVLKTARGQSILSIPGPRPDDTTTWVPAREILETARRGLYGLSILDSTKTPETVSARS